MLRCSDERQRLFWALPILPITPHSDATSTSRALDRALDRAPKAYGHAHHAGGYQALATTSRCSTAGCIQLRACCAAKNAAVQKGRGGQGRATARLLWPGATKILQNFHKVILRTVINH